MCFLANKRLSIFYLQIPRATPAAMPCIIPWISKTTHHLLKYYIQNSSMNRHQCEQKQIYNWNSGYISNKTKIVVVLKLRLISKHPTTKKRRITLLNTNDEMWVNDVNPSTMTCWAMAKEELYFHTLVSDGNAIYIWILKVLKVLLLFNKSMSVIIC